MDPQQSAIYGAAQGDLQDLFRELARHGRVSAVELQQGLLPFTAGDARRDLQELIDDMKRKRTSLDEPEFVRVLWRRMYVNNVLFTARQTRVIERHDARGPVAASSLLSDAPSATATVNIPLAHVIVSIKRRAQLKQFADYYASRGISGADRLHVETDAVHSTTRATPRHVLQMQRRRQAAAAAAAHIANITALRERTSPAYDVVVYAYDRDTLAMRAHTLLKSVTDAHAATCSRLHCVLFSRQRGHLVLSSRHFIERLRLQTHQCNTSSSDDRDSNEGSSEDESGDVSAEDESPSWHSSIVVTKLDDVGIKNAVALGVGRGVVTVSTERRVYTWSIPEESSSPEQSAAADLLADEGDAFGIVGGTPLLKRRKTVAELHGVRSLVCGDGFAIGVCSGTELFCWGAAPLGRSKSSPTPLSLTTLGADPSSRVAVQRVACGLHHAVLLLACGKLFSWGSNVHGQLGLGSDRSVLDAHEPNPTPVQLPGSSTALDIACGDHHTVVLTDTGGLVAFGNNWHGQLGLDPTTTDSGCVFEPTRVFWWRPLVTQREDDGDTDIATEVSLPTPLSGAPSPSKTSSASQRQRGKPPSTTTYQPSAPRVYLLTAIGDTTAVVDEHGHVYVWGICVPPGALAGAAGLVGRWSPQRMDVTSEGGTAAIARRRVVMEGGTAAPWSSVAVANGLVVLVRHSVSSSAGGT